ncbi:MAG: ATP-binding cassette domain-containing protein [Firmicutes bacterium]|nr:ATP-binding cassette domain-containing protein [Bacillota bacterium]
MLNDKTYYLKSNHQLFDATLNEFSERPFELASLNEIIKRSNSNKGSFYYRFSDKKELYFALIDDMFTQQVNYINDSIEGLMSQLPFDQQLKMLFDSLIQLMQMDPRFLEFSKKIYSESKSLQSEIREKCVLSPLERLFMALDFSNQVNVKQLSLLKESIQHFYSVFSDFKDSPNFKMEDYLRFITNSASLATKELTEDSKQKVIVDIKDLSYTYQLSTNTIHQATFQLFSGEIFALVGDEDSGKSTISRLLAGQLKRYEGSIQYIDDETVDPPNVPHVLLSSDKPVFHLKKTISQNIELMNKSHHLNIDLSQELKDIGLEGMEDILYKDLSDDSKQLLLISKAIWMKPKVLIINQMIYSLSPYHLGLISRKLLKYKAKGSTIVLIDSKLDQLLDLADRIAFIDRGFIKKISYSSDIKKKYDSKKVIIRYTLNGLEYSESIPLSMINTLPFQEKYKDKQLIEINMVHKSYDEILKIEIGEHSNE